MTGFDDIRDRVDEIEQRARRTTRSPPALSREQKARLDELFSLDDPEAAYGPRDDDGPTDRFLNALEEIDD